jgi:thiol-disulfide isomerase/thioredoxin
MYLQTVAGPLDAAGLERLSKLSPEEIEKSYAGSPQPEAVTMMVAVLRGSKMGPGEGWFGPARSRYSWQWLTKRCGVSDDSTISASTFPGSTLLFSRLDRNQDGLIDEDDLDWSAKNPWVQQGYLMHRLFRRMNPEGSGRLTREQWLGFFEEARGDKDYLTAEDIRDAFLRGTSKGMFAGDMPKQDVLIRGLITGELGSFHEGPAIGGRAPNFTLSTHDGAKRLSLVQVIGDKPVVLVFGNFTCPPFRAMYQGVEEVYKRFRGQAEFLAIYVREAHPTDGWCMASNDRVGVRTRQPATYDERVSVASRCHQLLHPSVPLLVDDIHDPVGSDYSGLPARLYVLDREGRVAYQSGRGPFGFKVGEMEQALIMSLLDL